MESKNCFPHDLAESVNVQLKRRRVKTPSKVVLKKLFETMYFASLKTEEAQQIFCTITYIDSDKPDPKPPERITADRWSYTRFGEKLSFTVGNLVKLSKAADPSASSLAIYSDKQGEIYIWGMIDQAYHYHNFINHETDVGPERPGHFHATITGLGCISVYKNYSLIASLKQNRIVSQYHDILWSGPISKMLRKNIFKQIQSIRESVGYKIFDLGINWPTSIAIDRLNVLCRILLNIQGYRHGGAILITPQDNVKGLNVKYKINYKRLHELLNSSAEKTILRCYAEQLIFENYLNKQKEKMPVELYLEESCNRTDEEDITQGITGCIRFISSLSCVDGLVLLNENLVVKGFGAEITVKAKPKNVYFAGDCEGNPDLLSKVNFDHFGTRHRSMMRYCYQNEGSIGFVISQDGDIRAMTKIDDDLILWENIKVHTEFDS